MGSKRGHRRRRGGASSLLDAAPIPTLVLRDFQVVYANDAALALLQGSRDDVVGRAWADFVPTEEMAWVEDRVTRRLHGEVPLPLVHETSLRCGSETRPVRIRAGASGRDVVVQVLERPGEELGLVLEVGRSLVATLELDEVLQAGARNLARIVDAPDAYVLLADVGGKQMVIRAAAGAHPELVGHALDISSTQSVSQWVHRNRAPLVVEDAEADSRVDRSIRELTGARAYLGVPLVVRDRSIGAAVITETRTRRQFSPPQVDRAAAIANQLAVAVENARLYEDLRRSYAELAQAQDRLVRHERLAALGELAAVVAHEVRNPLGAIFNSLATLRRLVRPEGDARMLFEIVAEEADRLNRIVGDLLAFARPSSPALQPEPLERVLDDAVAAALTSARGPVQVARDVPEGLPLVPMDARLMRQAFLNVALNAAQAMPDGGTLSVRARVENAMVAIELGDTGPGIAEEARDRVFEPFFTTKATGTGIGLALVKRILDDHHGSVEVRSLAQGGTTFTLRLPLGGGEPGPARDE